MGIPGENICLEDSPTGDRSGGSTEQSVKCRAMLEVHEGGGVPVWSKVQVHMLPERATERVKRGKGVGVGKAERERSGEGGTGEVGAQQEERKEKQETATENKAKEEAKERGKEGDR